MSELDEIRARLEASDEIRYAHPDGSPFTHVEMPKDDIAYLLAEVKRLEGERDEALALHADALASWNKSIDRVSELGLERNELQRLALSLAEALGWFNIRRFAIQSKFDLHGPADMAEAMRGAFKASDAALSSPALLKLKGGV